MVKDVRHRIYVGHLFLKTGRATDFDTSVFWKYGCQWGVFSRTDFKFYRWNGLLFYHDHICVSKAWKIDYKE